MQLADETVCLFCNKWHTQSWRHLQLWGPISSICLPKHDTTGHDVHLTCSSLIRSLAKATLSRYVNDNWKAEWTHVLLHFIAYFHFHFTRFRRDENSVNTKGPELPLRTLLFSKTRVSNKSVFEPDPSIVWRSAQSSSHSGARRHSQGWQVIRWWLRWCPRQRGRAQEQDCLRN